MEGKSVILEKQEQINVHKFILIHFNIHKNNKNHLSTVAFISEEQPSEQRTVHLESGRGGDDGARRLSSQSTAGTTVTTQELPSPRNPPSAL